MPASDKVYHYWQKLCDNDMIPNKSDISPELFVDGDYYSAFLVCDENLRTVDDTVFSQPVGLPEKFHFMKGSPKISSLKALKELTDTFITALSIPAGVMIKYDALNVFGDKISDLEIIYLPVSTGKMSFDTLFAVGSLADPHESYRKNTEEIVDLTLGDIQFFELNVSGKSVSYMNTVLKAEAERSELRQNG